MARTLEDACLEADALCGLLEYANTLRPEHRADHLRHAATIVKELDRFLAPPKETPTLVVPDQGL